MAVRSPEELFLYELSAMYDAERSGGQLLGWLGGQVRHSDLTQLLRTQEQESQQQLRNLDSCFQSRGFRPLDISSTTAEGLRNGVEVFVAVKPSPETLELFTLDTAMRLAHFGIASYKRLVDRALLMGDSHCTQMLQTNLIQKEESAGKLDRVGHEMGQRFLAAA
jgi:ferritin-like metal-binding protein YciE